MKYMGSKNRHAKEILPIILKERSVNQWYVEPFVGGFNVIDKVDGNRIANDSNPYLIALFGALQDGWIPPRYVGEIEYKYIQQNMLEHPDYLIGYVGFNSYGAKFFGGYRRDTVNLRNYWREHYNNVMKQVPKLNEIIITCNSYDKVIIPDNSIIYCDPPYAGTTKYRDDFDHSKFWQWARERAMAGHRLFVSEYTAPDDFAEVWSKQVNNTLAKDTGSKKGVEKLFIHNTQFE